MKTFDLGPATLGPVFTAHTEQSLYDYILSLRQERSLGKVPSLGRKPAKPVVFHTTAGVCTICGNKVKKPGSKCSQRAKKEKEITGQKIPCQDSPA